MFTLFVTALAAVVSALLVFLLLKPNRTSQPLRLPLGGLGVAAAALALAALGLWLM